MSLKPYQYNRILREYDSKQLQSKWELKLRTTEIYKLIPEYKELDDRIASGSIEYARMMLTDSSSADADDIRKTNASIEEAKRALLTAHGFPADYLEPRYTCPDCKDTGFIGNEKCHCFKQEIVNVLYSQSNLKTTLSKENFSTFDLDYYDTYPVDPVSGLTPYENARRALETCHEFIDGFDSGYRNLLIYGNTGIGKTFLCNCIAKELLDKSHTVVYLTAFQLFDVLEKYAFKKFDKDEFSEEQNTSMDYILNCDLLIIDDLGTELTNSFISSRLYLCINERDLREKPTVISTNLALDDLNRNYSERIFSRIMSNYSMIKMTGDDIRVKKTYKMAHSS